MRWRDASRRRTAYLSGLFVLVLLVWGVSLSLAGEEICSGYSSGKECVSSLKEEFSHYESEVEVYTNLRKG